MLKLKKYFFIVSIAISFNVYAVEYDCPQIISEIKVGSYMNDNWLVWPLDEEITKFNIYYYKFFGKTYNIKMWNAYPHGKYSGNFNGSKYFIACCRQIKKEKRRICAFKSINEKKCKPILRRDPTVKFICENNLKEKNEV